LLWRVYTKSEMKLKFKFFRSSKTVYETRKPSWRKGYAWQRRHLVNALEVRLVTFAVKVEFLPPPGEYWIRLKRDNAHFGENLNL